MAKVIKLTEALREEARRDFERYLSVGKCQNGEFSFKHRFAGTDGKRAKILFTPKAWQKMFLLLDHYDTEVSWRGICLRGEEPGTYVVSDILVFPQKVTGSTATTDEQADTAWICSLPSEVKRTVRFHGHSHVNMGAFSSPTDTGYQQEILGQLLADDYYVFMIWNKKHDFWATVFDMRDNIQYEDKDISVILQGTDWDPKSFLEEADKLVVKSVSTYTSGYSGSSYGHKAGSNGCYASCESSPGSPVVVSKKNGKSKKSKIPVPTRVESPAEEEGDDPDDPFVPVEHDAEDPWMEDLRASFANNYPDLYD